MLKIGYEDVESYAFYKQYIRSKKNNVIKFNQLSKEEQEELKELKAATKNIGNN